MLSLLSLSSSNKNTMIKFQFKLTLSLTIKHLTYLCLEYILNITLPTIIINVLVF